MDVNEGALIPSSIEKPHMEQVASWILPGRIRESFEVKFPFPAGDVGDFDGVISHGLGRPGEASSGSTERRI